MTLSVIIVIVATMIIPPTVNRHELRDMFDELELTWRTLVHGTTPILKLVVAPCHGPMLRLLLPFLTTYTSTHGWGTSQVSATFGQLGEGTNEIGDLLRSRTTVGR